MRPSCSSRPRRSAGVVQEPRRRAPGRRQGLGVQHALLRQGDAAGEHLRRRADHDRRQRRLPRGQAEARHLLGARPSCPASRTATSARWRSLREPGRAQRHHLPRRLRHRQWARAARGPHRMRLAAMRGDAAGGQGRHLGRTARDRGRTGRASSSSTSRTTRSRTTTSRRAPSRSGTSGSGPSTVRAAGQFSPEPVAAETAVPGPGQTATVDLRLQPTSRLTGTVYDSDGFTPVTEPADLPQVQKRLGGRGLHRGPAVRHRVPDRSPRASRKPSPTTDSQGRFIFPVVNAGPFTLTATDNANDPDAQGQGRRDQGPGARRATSSTVAAPARPRPSHRPGLPQQRHTPVTGATVRIKQLQYPQREDSGTAVGGTITFEGLGEGDYVVTAVDAERQHQQRRDRGGRKSARIAPEQRRCPRRRVPLRRDGLARGRRHAHR